MASLFLLFLLLSLEIGTSNIKKKEKNLREKQLRIAKTGYCHLYLGEWNLKYQ
jgi:hypothetical protein